MNKTVLEGKWLDIKGEILNKWGKITDDDMIQTKGNLVSIVGLIQEKYGHAKEEVTEALNKLMDSFSAKADETKKAVTSEASAQTEDVKLDLRK